MCRGQGCDGKAKVQTKMGTSSVVSLATLKVTGVKSQHTKSLEAWILCALDYLLNLTLLSPDMTQREKFSELFCIEIWKNK